MTSEGSIATMRKLVERINTYNETRHFSWFVCFECNKLILGEAGYAHMPTVNEVRAFCDDCYYYCSGCDETYIGDHDALNPRCRTYIEISDESTKGECSENDEHNEFIISDHERDESDYIMPKHQNEDDGTYHEWNTSDEEAEYLTNKVMSQYEKEAGWGTS